MRSFILVIVILMAVPAYAVGQQRERSATGRTAVPRDEAVHSAPASQTGRRAEPRRETRTSLPREESSDVAAPPPTSVEHGNRTSVAETERGRAPGEPPQAVPARTHRPSSPKMPGDRSPIASPDHGRQPFPDRDHRQPRDGDGNYRPWDRRPYRGANVVFLPYAAPVVVERDIVIERHIVDESKVAVVVEEPSLARLILDIHPPTAQVFADGYYIGIPEDFRFENGGAVLEPGPHRIDILAREYKPVSFEVNLARGQSATFRQILTPITRAPQPAPNASVTTPPTAKQPMTFYLIPGCYMGNVPPKEANLPATCDIARAVSYQY